MIRTAMREALERGLRIRLIPFGQADWAASAVVFAPHPDDETLGCGGAVCKKIAAGADVRFVFVTDGAASHAGRIEPKELRAMREHEAVAAVCRLGAPSDRVKFLGFPDGAAARHTDRIARETETLLQSWQPESVFLPHAQDPPPDHFAVNRGVRAAIQTYGRRVTVYEYPVWYWYHWPWVRITGDLPGMWRMTARQTIRTVAGLRALSTFNMSADIRDVLHAKHEALSAHASQMARLEGCPHWPILPDLAHGDFITRLLAPNEVFTRYEIGA